MTYMMEHEVGLLASDSEEEYEKKGKKTHRNQMEEPIEDHVLK